MLSLLTIVEYIIPTFIKMCLIRGSPWSSKWSNTRKSLDVRWPGGPRFRSSYLQKNFWQKIWLQIATIVWPEGDNDLWSTSRLDCRKWRKNGNTIKLKITRFKFAFFKIPEQFFRNVSSYCIYLPIKKLFC